MDYRDIVRIVVWSWFALSCVVLIRRSLDKRRSPEPGTTPPLGDARTDLSAGGLLAESPPRYPAPPVPPPTPGGTTGPAAALGGTPAATGPEVPPATPTGSIFDPPPDRPTASEEGSASRPAARPVAIAEMVRGIKLPCDLTPMVAFERRGGVREQVVFVTRTVDADTVGRELGEELRRLGFELASHGHTEAEAIRGDDRMGVAVHAVPAGVERADRPAFPGAGEHAVVVELWTD